MLSSGSLIYSQKEVDLAWDKFFVSSGDVKILSVRDLVLKSWQRSLAHGINPDQKLIPAMLSDDEFHLLHKKHIDLIRCSQPVLNNIRTLLADLKMILILLNHQGMNVGFVGNEDVIVEAKGVGLISSSGWQEALCGTNSMGTTIATGLAAQIHGEEHFLQVFKPWTCTAEVIRDPYDMQIIGVLDISGLAKDLNIIHAPLLSSWAHQIELNLAIRNNRQWHCIREVCNQKDNHSRNSESLLFDIKGRLINYFENAKQTLNTLGIDYDPESKCRLSFERFGGDEIVYPHDNGAWIKDDWLEPIKDSNTLLGFQLHMPVSNRAVDFKKLNPNPDKDPFSKIYGQSASYKASLNKARMAASTRLPVLLLGDTGVGKESFAKAIHESSNYSNGPLIDLNCGAISKTLLNSELFGHIDGAFTGASKDGMTGKIEAANGGTLFLDEVAEIPLELQPVFLRVLQDYTIYRVGDVKPISVDFRLIVATNVDLRKEVAEGRFRSDLYYRLSTIIITLDPLSKRQDDIEGIANSVLERIKKTQQIIPRSIAPSLTAALKEREWPGNIRELVNVVEYMCFMSSNAILNDKDLPEDYTTDETAIKSARDVKNESPPAPVSIQHLEQQAIENAINQCAGNITFAAKNLGIAKGTLYRKMEKYGLKNTARRKVYNAS
ncbi:MAG: transcriptional regulator of acetoin/glycerol metabolism [Gammaproteobacteria bacterium]|jgi:transcriptional regulator of acetoin/glycerol metabolism